jgi:hypothetical protein
MSKITETDKKLIDGIISTIDWDQVLKFYKVLDRRVGYEQLKIKGITRGKVTLDGAKEELEKVLEYVIENDLTELSYGCWLILWINGAWENIEIIQTENEEEPVEEIVIPILESKLQVLFIAQSATMTEELDIPEFKFEIEGGLNLEDKLKESIEKEDYILAGKLRDVIEELNKRK